MATTNTNTISTTVTFRFNLYQSIQVLNSYLNQQQINTSNNKQNNNITKNKIYEKLQSIFNKREEQFSENDRVFALDQLSLIMMTEVSESSVIARIFRPLIIEFVTRYLNTHKNNIASIETISDVFSRILPIAPQLLAQLTDWSVSIKSNIKHEANIIIKKQSELENGIYNFDKSILFLNNNEDLLLISKLEEEQQQQQQLQQKVNENCFIKDSDFSGTCVDVCGILLFRRFQQHAVGDAQQDILTKSRQQLVYTPTVSSNLKSLAIAVGLGKPILMEGVTGAGKTTLVNELAALTDNYSSMIKIHLGDQTDSKVLLGTYITSDVPGEFKWQPGALTQAVSQGRWILIEDIDLAPIDVLSVLISLLESRTLFIPSRGEAIEAANGFQLFATQTLFGGHSRDQHTNILSHLWTRVVIEAMSATEMHQVLLTLFPDLKPLIQKFIDTFNLLLRVLSGQGAAKSNTINVDLQDTNFQMSTNRFLSSRDLLKWIKRCNQRLMHSKITHFTSTIQDVVFTEAVDCFCSMIPKRNLRVKLIEVIGRCWDLTSERIQHFIDLYKPQVQIDTQSLKVGRGNLTMLTKSDQVNLKSASGQQKQRTTTSTFAHTINSLRLIEKISVSIEFNEPILLVGETGTGKTSVIQYIADQLNQKLVVLNLNQQSDSSDLIGGFKPVEMRLLCAPLKQRFESMFKDTFSETSNTVFLEKIQTSFANRNWKSFISLLTKAVRLVEKQLNKEKSNKEQGTKKSLRPEKRQRWKNFAAEVATLSMQFERSKNSFAFSFVEGSLVDAIRKGHWVLLDEINLATSETLESLSGLFEGGSLTLTEKGEVEPVTRHPNFKVFACMNPPTDIGKKDLPPGIRNRFTEFYVDDLDNRADLCLVVKTLLTDLVPHPPIEEIVDFYLATKKEAQLRLLDGANQKPHFSLRTLSRALHYTRFVSQQFGFQRALYEGINMSFLTQINRQSTPIMEQLINQYIRKGDAKQYKQPLKQPSEKHIQIEQFWVQTGENEPVVPQHYILTQSIKTNLNNLARILVSRKHPILLQGPTSSGKTSMVEYLAIRTGHRFIRINNHEHTDLQEYLGQYISDDKGKLVFQEGILVEAVRNGYWVVLDELNLAPSEVLEALNRLLDDNRELYIPETQEIVKPHPSFMLFATQNPPGLYGGRKVLSRAFRNRFLELHVDDIPENELEEILGKRCKLPPTYCKKLVAIMKELQLNRQGANQVFAGKHGYITFRDLFRWAERYPSSYDELGIAGYMLLAERLRKDEEKAVIKSVIEKHLKIKMDMEKIYDCSATEEFKEMLEILAKDLPPTMGYLEKIVWTGSMKRLFTLVGQCLRFKEPILLVGETGCSKTTICQLYSLLTKQHLHILNCHQHTETADFLGGLRPVRGREQLLQKFHQLIEQTGLPIDLQAIQQPHEQLEQVQQLAKQSSDDKKIQELLKEIEATFNQYQSLFTWVDGPLVEAMKQGHYFLIDEISLAEDAVLERLNSVLEPSRLLVLAEKGGLNIEELRGAESFRIMATMNPGGDFGKKELSPAMRNRFTEIWVPAITSHQDLLQIIEERFTPQLKCYSQSMLEFIEYLNQVQKNKRTISLRDILSWVSFMNLSIERGLLKPDQSYVHGACLVLLDGFGMGANSTSESDGLRLRKLCLTRLIEQITEETSRRELTVHFLEHQDNPTAAKNFIHGDRFGVEPFFISLNKERASKIQFSLGSPTTSRNALRVLRGMQLPRAILIEGSPGVGKTSLITAIAQATGNQVVRINLSEQTDIMDLLGSDLPVEGGKGGQFEWRDGIFLKALREGSWVLLDELNLASQTVLEGLNACLDHRAEVFIPELGRTFACHPSFRVFACQNPLHQGGGRKGLPKSFLNRFTQVFIDQLDASDLLFITSTRYPQIKPEVLAKMIEFNRVLHHDSMVDPKFGRKGSPWEFNLRDIFRWCDLVVADSEHLANYGRFVDLIYLQRMRTKEDRLYIQSLYNRLFAENPMDFEDQSLPQFSLTPQYVQIGKSLVHRKQQHSDIANSNNLQVLQRLLNPLESILKCIEMGWMSILIGSTSTSKTSSIRLLAQLTGNTLYEFSMNSSVDTTELLGGFEQVDLVRHQKRIANATKSLIDAISGDILQQMTPDANVINSSIAAVQDIHQAWSIFKTRSSFVDLSIHSSPKSASTTTNTPAIDMEQFSILIQILGALEKVIQQFPAFERANQYLEEIQTIHQQIDRLKLIENESVTGCFEWIDGLLIKALETGAWIAIDNANFCNPTVLDRLNPLLENDGVLMLSERGMVDGEVKIIKPHPDFRIFLTMDDRKGEISRAMRNRGIEIYLFEADITMDSNVIDNTRLLAAQGIPSLALARQMIAFQTYVLQQFGSTIENPITLSHIIYWGRLLVDLLQRGYSLARALHISMQQIFIRPRRHNSQREAINRHFHTLFSDAQLKSMLLNQESSQSLESLGFFPVDHFDLLSRSTQYALNKDVATLKHFNFQHEFNQNQTKIMNETMINSIIENPSKYLLSVPTWLLSAVLFNPSTNKNELHTISEQQQVDQQSKIGQYIQYSGLYFIESISTHNQKERLKWLKQQQQHFGKAQCDMYTSVIKSLFASPLYSSFDVKLNQLLEKLSLPKYLADFQGHQWKNNESLFELLSEKSSANQETKQDWQSIVHFMDLLKILLFHHFQSYLQQRIYLAGMKETVSSNMTPVLQSYLCSAKKISKESLTSEIIMYLYPFFKSLSEQFEQWVSSIVQVLEKPSESLTTIIPMAKIEHLVRLMANFWKSLNVAPSFSLGEFIIRWKWMIKEVRSINQMNQSLFGISANLNTVAEHIQRQLNQSMLFSNNNRLWKQNGHPIVMKTEQLVQLDQEFLDLAQKVQFNHRAINESPLLHPISFITQEWRSTFVEALSTLYWINYQYYEHDQRAADNQSNPPALGLSAMENAKQLIPSLVEVQSVLKSKLEALQQQNNKMNSNTISTTIDPERGAMSEEEQKAAAQHVGSVKFDLSTLRHSKSGMWPLFQHSSALLESSIISRLTLLLLNHNLDTTKGVVKVDQILPMISGLIGDLSTYLGNSLSDQTVVNPVSLVPYQKLKWMLEGIQESTKRGTSNVNIGIVEVQSIIHSILFNWNQTLWNNSFNDLSYLERSSKPSYLLANKSVPLPVTTRFDSITLGSGPPRLFQSIQSIFSFYLTNEFQYTTLQNVPNKISQIQSLISHIGSLPSNPKSIYQTEWVSYVNLLFVTVGCFVKLYQSEDQSQLLNQLLQLGQQVGQWSMSAELVEQLAGLLKRSSNSTFNQHIEKLIVPALETLHKRLKEPVVSTLDDQTMLGKFSLLVSCFRVLWLLPVHPVDPTQKYSVILDYSKEILNQVEDELYIRQLIERQQTGKQTNLMIRELTTKKEEIDQQLTLQQKRITLRPVPGQFEHLHRDLTQFVAQFAQIDKIVDLVDQFERGTTELVVLFTTESMWQEKSDNFINSLNKKYHLYYRDISVPIATAVLQMKYGLRMMCDATKHRSISASGDVNMLQLQQVLNTVCRFPRFDHNIDPLASCEQLVSRETIQSIRNILISRDSTGDSTSSSDSNYRVIALLVKSSVAQLFSHLANSKYLTSDILRSVDSIFRIFIEEYKHQEEERKAAEAEAAQTVKFRTKSHKMETMEERDERVFLTSFPNFYKEFSDLEDILIDSSMAVDDEAPPAQSQSTGGDANDNEEDEDAILFNQAITDEEIQQIYLIHKQLFSQLDGISLPSKQVQLEINERDRVKLFKMFYECGNLLLKVMDQRAPTKFDQDSLGAHLLNAILVKEKLSENPPSMITYSKLDKNFKFIKQVSSLGSNANDSVLSHDTTVYNIYTDSNIAEITIVREPLIALKNRIAELLVEFEEHPILSLLLRLCNRILECPSSDPLIKIVTGLELLVRKAQEWEAFAHKLISLREPHLNTLFRIITRWRKLEIESWPTVFQNQERQCELKSLKTWMSLYEIVNDTPTIEVLEDQDQLNAHFEEIFKTLQEYLYTSSFGELTTRLATLKTFDSQLLASVQLSENNVEKQYKLRLSYIVHNLYKYFYNFLPVFEKKLAQLIQPIEEKAIEFIRLARWEDNKLLTQYERLKAHIEKSHKTLAKITINYKNVLAQPVFKIFTELDADKLDLEHISINGVKQQKKTTKKSKNSVQAAISYEVLDLNDWIQLGGNRYHSNRQDIAPISVEQVLQARFQLQNAELHQNQLGLLSRRLADIAQKDILECQAYEMVHLGVETLDQLAGEIIEQTNHLSTNDDVKRKEKQFALQQLIGKLTDLGVQYRLSFYPQEQLQTNYLFNVPSIVDSALSVTSSSKLINGNALIHQADAYYYRIVARVNILRQKSLEFHSDLTQREVQKTGGFVEYLLSQLIQQRSEIIQYLEQFNVFNSFVSLFNSLVSESSNTIANSQTLVQRCLHSQQYQFNKMTNLTSELCLLATKQNDYLPSESKSMLIELNSRIATLKQSVDNEIGKGRQLYQFLDKSLTVATSQTYQLLVDNIETIKSIVSKSQEFIQSLGNNQNIFISPINQLIQSSNELINNWNNDNNEVSKINRESDPESVQQFTNVLENIIGHILLSIQNKKKLSNSIQKKEVLDTKEKDQDQDEEEQAEYEIIDGHVSKLYSYLSKQLSMLHLDTLNIEFKNLHSLLVQDKFTIEELNLIKMKLNQVQPMLNQFLLISNQSVMDMFALHKTVSKLEYIITGVFLQLYSKGFCKKEDQDTEADGDGSGDFEDDVEGTGMGEGEGKKDVSDRIEDQEQIMGTKDEKKEEKEEKEDDKDEDEEDKDKGFDMENDFEGDINDVKKDEKDDSDQESEEEEEHDKEMGELEKPEDNVIDEKLWGEEDVQDEEEQKEEGKGEETNSDEVMGKDEDEQKKDDKKKNDDKKKEEKKKEEKKEEKEEKDKNNEEEGEDEDSEMGDEEDFVGEDEDQVENQEDPEEDHHLDQRKDEQFEIPENMEIEDEEEEPGAEGEEKEEDPFEIPEDDGKNNDEEGEDKDKEDEEKDTDGSDADEEKDDEEKENEEENEQDFDGGENKGADMDHVEPESDKEDEKEQEEDNGTSLTANEQDQPQESEQPLGVKDKTGMKSNSANQEQDEEDPENKDEDAGDDNGTALPTPSNDANNSSLKNMRNPNAQQQAAPQKKQKPQIDPNPYRSLGDLQKEWKKKLKMLNDDEQTEDTNIDEKAPKQDDSAQDKEDQQEYQYIPEDKDNKEVDTEQALGAATENQMQEDHPKQQTESEDDGQDDEMDIDQQEIQHKDHPENEQKLPDKKTATMSKMPMAENKPKIQEEAEEEEKLKEKENEDETEGDTDVLTKDKSKENISREGGIKDEDAEMSEEDDQDTADEDQQVDKRKLTRDDFDKMRQDLEQWKVENSNKLEYGNELWKKYEQLTSDLSQDLCEQLRLILEPTLATKLEGDYKTGKRINMKKVIPYIASQFKKDKIWLRRTKPNKRQYQVLLAIDDTESMAIYHSGQFALEAMTMISRAMSRLEVGQLGIMRFGEDVSLVHSFDQPFSDQCGAQIIPQFTFKQGKTDMVTFLSKSIQIMEMNKQMQSSEAAAQLMFIVSDGWSLRDPENTKKWLREAKNKNLFIVFIVIDNPVNNHSILDFESISFNNGKIQRTNYMNEFPFPYYVILRSLENLPQILGDTLRQWFEMIKHIE
ncbi:type A von Willebrand factor domain-containing protein [Heterostelium album PN500]|uniref:Midasin n=1 Tax=Heterostelium pallidum (strain ATCC 26659 / Pp 5 / PN500) TaxID=670386 RepID=D3B0N0_HETP5|nr:type A von Willebrand factor domain-containing protein [Heterostelium album PN500]EFA84854.1 type A von Willebrand factor domain-containing protein [Heterostelium album PN500]|eukprot:XP_020436965.1 type A von Willebrand factor domain-containing protein [Heterostelium album PN500]